MRGVIGKRRAIDAAFEELEDVLLSADIGITKTDEILDELRQRYKDGEMAEGRPMQLLQRCLRDELDVGGEGMQWQTEGPTVLL